MGFNPGSVKQSYTVREVENELVQGSMPHLRFQLSEDKGRLCVKQPSRQARDIVDRAAREAGEKTALSGADLSVIGLALDLKTSGLTPVIVSDDYAVQNLAEHLGIGYSSLASFGIVHKFNWVMYCPACHRRYDQPAKKCRVCGTALRRKVLSKARLRKSL